ncbi:polysaccharide lyase family 4, domain III-domain-containing protein [Leptodontidium sp. MPI-SDFR-AT-0119]|nr:polysaccharide lyase family 4, domain III-domain-containing protein [Leptodontidium sp. MPI-SDFR-AT-0119]
MYFRPSSVLALAATFLGIIRLASAAGPFFTSITATQHVLGNDIWNITVGTRYGTRLYYKGRDLVGKAAGHYVSHSGGTSLDWTSGRIFAQNEQFLDVVFEGTLGDFHWVIYPDLAGAYQYFVNKALPTLGEFRTLFRLDNTTFVNGKTAVKEGPLPTLAEIATATNVQDETWQLASGAYITKYDWSSFLRSPSPSRSSPETFHGVYGPDFGSWIITPGKDEFNGNQLKQELLLHRESKTGDVVLLNMLHGTHFMASSNDQFAIGKTWGPWLWYLNDGSIPDASARASIEISSWPYKWFTTSPNYQPRGSLSGKLKLSDGRPASNAAIFLGDNNSNISTLDQGANNYYTTFTSPSGSFNIPHIRVGKYALSAWSNGSPIGDVSTVFLQNDISISQDTNTALGNLEWKTQERKCIFQIGEMDRKTLGFMYGGAERQHGLSDKCPSNMTFTIGKSRTEEWCYAQSSVGSWTINFSLPGHVGGNSSFVNSRNGTSTGAAVLSVSLAGYSSGVDSEILVNGVKVGGMLSKDIPNDPALYRSGTTAGEWHFFEFAVPGGLLRGGGVGNEVVFRVTKGSRWHGFMWDSVILEWA